MTSALILVGVLGLKFPWDFNTHNINASHQGNHRERERKRASERERTRERETEIERKG